MKYIVVSVIALCFLALGIGGYTYKNNLDTNTKQTEQRDKDSVTYLPLGDSYTIGESVAEEERWPNQLVSRLKTENILLRIVDNPARTGYTSQRLIDEELPLVKKFNPHVVSVQIGVNDYVQGISKDTYRINLEKIFDSILLTVPKDHIFVVTTPDFGKTPVGRTFGDPAEIEKNVKELNAILAEVAEARQISLVDIFSFNTQVANTPTLTAPDALHPSATQYKLWVDKIMPVAKDRLNHAHN